MRQKFLISWALRINGTLSFFFYDFFKSCIVKVFRMSNIIKNIFQIFKT